MVEVLGSDDIVISTTGKTSRELYECREARGEGHDRDFLTVGSMGHTSSIAAGFATARPERRVICLDGDGSMIMHMGAMAIIGNMKPENLLHIVINNGVHDSVGGQSTVGLDIDMPAIAKACGYRNALCVQEANRIREAIERLWTMSGPAFLEVRARKGSREDLGRPTTTPKENQNVLMKRLGIDKE